MIRRGMTVCDGNKGLKPVSGPRLIGLIAGLMSSAAMVLAASDALALNAQSTPKIFPPFSTPPRGATPPIDKNGEYLLRADDVVYDQTNDLVTATGNVEISQGDRVLLADTVTYARKTGAVTANGHLSLLEPSGEVIFGDSAEMQGDLKEGIIQNFRALLIDNSRLAATAATRTDGSRKELSRAVFSPCNLCAEDPTQPPTWQIKAARVTHDEVAHDVIYRDATIELFGYPVFYTPYISHPDPTVKRRSGFLLPAVGQSSQLGAYFGVPYYYVIDQSSDATIEPFVYTEQGPLLGTEYRKRFSAGTMRLAGSAGWVNRVDGTNQNADKGLRGNIAGEALFEIDDTWRTGFNLDRATDITYQRRYKLANSFRSLTREDNTNQLTSDGFVEGFDGRNYARAAAYAFQTLRTDISQSQIGRVHPYAVTTNYFQTEDLPGYFRVNASALSLSRTIGNNVNRVSTWSAYTLPFTTSGGQVFSWTTSVQADAYDVSDLSGYGANGGAFSGTLGRVYPQTALRLDYPLVNHRRGISYLIEPTVQLVAGTNGGNSNRIPNEDSRSFDLDETNLFALQRFQGSDRVSSGQRVDYGMRLAAYGDAGGAVNAFAGQSLRAQRDTTYPTGSGLEKQSSDVVGALNAQPLRWLNALYRVRLDNGSLSVNRQEITLGLNGYSSNIGVSYIEYNPRTLVNESRGVTGSSSGYLQPSTRSASIGFKSEFDDYWTGYGNFVRDLAANQTRSVMLGALFRNECIGFTLTYERDYYTVQDLRPNNTFLFRLGLKYIGDLGA